MSLDCLSIGIFAKTRSNEREKLERYKPTIARCVLKFSEVRELKLALSQLESKISEVVESRFSSMLGLQDRVVVVELVEGLILRSFIPKDLFGEKVLLALRSGNLVGSVTDEADPVVW